MLFCKPGSGQNDTVKPVSRGIIGVQLGGSYTQMNFSGLRHYEYLLNKPANAFGGMIIGFMLGNPDKFYGTLYFDHSFSSIKNGNYNGYTISAESSFLSLGILLTAPLYWKSDNKFMKGIYASAGFKTTTVPLFSKASGRGTTMQDTSFHFESSEVKAPVLNGEIMFEVFNLRPAKYVSFPPLPLAIRLGYNFQLQDPKWSGTYTRTPGDENPNVNLGGFYASIGLNVWMGRFRKK